MWMTYSGSLFEVFPERRIYASEEHQKAWLCRVTFNKCKDLKRSFWRRKVVSIEDMENTL
jgi:DNA-directed RNA polymerase specialized sigma24 family protein